MTSPSTDDPPPKSALICPACDHTSPPDGDWQLQRRIRTTVYRCPCCGTNVVERPSTVARGFADQIATMTAPIRALWSVYLRGINRLLDW